MPAENDERRRRVRGAGALRIALVCASLLLSAQTAGAQNVSNETLSRDSTLAYGTGLKTWDSRKMYGAEAVDERNRKPWLPDGLHIGNFYVMPSIATSVTFDDNIYGSATNRKADTELQVSPTVRIFSDLPRHSFDFAFGGRFTKFEENSNFDHIDGNAAANASIQINHAMQLAITSSAAYDHMDRINPDEPQAAREPTPFWHERVAASLKHDAGRLWASVGASFDDWRFENVHAFDGSIIDQSVRDQRVVASYLLGGYRFSPGYDLVVKTRALRQDNPSVANTITDAWGYEGATGIQAEINPLLRWRLLGGWGVRDYDKPGAASTSTALGEAGITWLPTQVLTVSLTARHDIADGSEIAGTAGRIDNLARALIEYEVLRNLVFTLQGDYHQLSYAGTSRRDQLYVGKAALEYLHTKNTALTLSYEYQYRQSNVDTDKLSRDRIMLEGKLRF